MNQLGLPFDAGRDELALRATGNIDRATSALHSLADSEAQQIRAAKRADKMTKWWHRNGPVEVESMDWYARESKLGNEQFVHPTLPPFGSMPSEDRLGNAESRPRQIEERQ